MQRLVGVVVPGSTSFNGILCLIFIVTGCAVPAGQSAQSVVATPERVAPAEDVPVGGLALRELPTPSPLAATTTPSATQSPTPSPTMSPSVTPVPPAIGNSAGRRAVLGYYVPYDPTSWQTLEAHVGGLDYVAPQWVSVDACGGIGSRDDRTLAQFVRGRGVSILPSLLTSSATLNHRLLTDPAVSDRMVREIVSYVTDEGYEGFDLDLEGVDGEDRPAYTAFVAKLSAALHAKGKVLTAALPAKAREATTGWAGAYDYAALAPHLDLVLIMTYDYSWANSAPGSIAPYEWMDQVMFYVTSQIPSSKVLLGLAFYGYDWNTTLGGRARALRHWDARALMEKYGAKITLDASTRSATFTYVSKAEDKPPEVPPAPALNHDVVVRKPGPCAVTLPTPTPPAPRPTVLPRPTSTPAPLQRHVVWIENAASIATRLPLAGKHGLHGVGTWRLGQEDPLVWPVFDEWRR